MMFKIKVNKDKIIDYKQEKRKLIINNELLNADFSQISSNRFSIIKGGKSYNAEITGFSKDTKTFTIKINGIEFETQIKDSLDLIIEKMGMGASAGLKVNEVKAPMPGLIIDIKVKEGQQVAEGEVLLILEAMKMENVIKSPRPGTVKSIRVKKGTGVEKNEILLEFSN